MQEQEIFGLQYLEETELTEEDVRGCWRGSGCTDDNIALETEY